MMLDLHYVDPRLVALYDIENPRGADTDFFLELATEINAKTIIDLGCGTGILTRELAADRSREVIGVDPASAMLAVAQQNDIDQTVTWVNGDASNIVNQGADLLLMTGNVAQIFLNDDDWLETLKQINHALRTGGHLAFESRNPMAKAWEEWTPEKTNFQFESPLGKVETWIEVLDVTPKTVHFQGFNYFHARGDTVVVDSTLRFRTDEEISASLEQTGFRVKEVYGDWQRGPFRSDSRSIVFVAVKRLTAESPSF